MAGEKRSTTIRHLSTVLILTLALSVIIVCYALRANSARAKLDVPAPATNSIVAGSPVSPTVPVKLIFVHHSTGGNWLANPNQDGPYGGLGQALMQNNYFVSATNYGWGPDSVGDRTDIPNWPEWFTGPNSSAILDALYNESGKNVGGFGDWSRMADPDPTRENEILMFKSCFPNSDLYGNPDDDAYGAPNDWEYSVSNSKAVYNELLTYFETRLDKLFIVITAPPMAEGEYTLNDPGTPAADRAANARAFNDWLMNDWLAGYPHYNVAVFDYYNVLTSNGSGGRIDDVTTNEEPNDASAADGNHHRWTGSAVTHTQSIDNNYAAYPYYSGGPDWYDSHPTASGHQKATEEFVPVLNVFYNRWQSGRAPAQPQLDLTAPTGSTVWPVDSQQQILWTTTPAGSVAQVNLHYSSDGVTTTLASAIANDGSYAWTTPITPTLSARVRVESVISPTTVFDVSDAFRLHATGAFTAYLPSAARNYSFTIAPPPINDLVEARDFSYRGAFRLPGGDTPPQTFAYGGNAMTFNPDGDPSNSDAYPGSLFVMGHDRQAYGGLPDGNQVAEISIPAPGIASDPADLPVAGFIQGFHDVTAGFFTQLEEVPKVGMQYLNHAETGPKIHLAWGQHLQPQHIPSHAWFDANLDAPDLQGVWFIGDQNLYSVNAYMFDIPSSWADVHAEGRYLATGRFRDGGQGGMGPALFVYRPWLAGGSAPVTGTHLAETTLLLYENVFNTDDIERNMDGYQHADEWEGGAWITTPSGKSAVLFAGTKSKGTKYWYGYINPSGPQYPCVDTDITDYVVCRLADGSPCPPEDLTGCCDELQGTCVSSRGWWSTRFDAEFILYDPTDLARVAGGEIESWEPQPYGSLDIDEHLYLDPPAWDVENLGWEVQRRYRIGAAAYDPSSGLLYVLELFAEQGKPVVHVWEIQ